MKKTHTVLSANVDMKHDRQESTITTEHDFGQTHTYEVILIKCVELDNIFNVF